MIGVQWSRQDLCNVKVVPMTIASNQDIALSLRKPHKSEKLWRFTQQQNGYLIINKNPGGGGGDGAGGVILLEKCGQAMIVRLPDAGTLADQADGGDIVRRDHISPAVSVCSFWYW